MTWRNIASGSKDLEREERMAEEGTPQGPKEALLRIGTRNELGWHPGQLIYRNVRSIPDPALQRT